MITDTPQQSEGRALMMRRLFIFMLVTLAGLLMGSALISLIVTEPPVTSRMRVATVIQDLFVFILPAVVIAVVSSRYTARFLSIDRGASVWTVVLAVAALMVSAPVQNLIIEWNAELSLPESMSSIDRWMRAAELRAQDSTSLLLGGTSASDLVMSLLIVGVLTGLGEELFFRGALQRILTYNPRAAHAAIWIGAFIFSAFHMQFMGFVPRMLLGAFFGYIVWWSGSLWPAVVTHIINNSVVVFSSWQSRRLGISNPTEGFGADNAAMLACSLLLTVVAIWLLRRCALRGRNGLKTD